MKRLLFDTSVYGELVKDLRVVDALAERIPKDFVVYGTRLIRRELRAISRKVKIGKESKRKLLLSVYDFFVRKDNHNLKETDIIETIAQRYYAAYKKFGGALSYDALANDFNIVACASVHRLDVVVSHDTASMLSGNAMRAYESVNKNYQLQLPEFIPYVKFKERLI